ncbi:uncharacterized protein [Antedon mediterranea]|uniref:uncharacterized protein n=1 Tax=Antedon mediterranea TaxID=105859 RepID=UPI003AF78740
MSEKACSSWESFLTENLLKTGLVDGVCLLSKRGCKLYSQGKLENIEKSEWKSLQDVCNSGQQAVQCDTIELAINSRSDKTKFYIYNKTLNSLYAKSSDAGLIICRIPTGCIICSYSSPVMNNKAVLAVERFADLLKA